MFGRNSGTKTKVADTAGTVKDAVADAAEAVVDYVDPLAKDEKLRERLAAALVAGAAARNRVRKQAGMRGFARRLATDPVLRAQLAEMTSALQAAQRRAKKSRGHRRRNAVLFVTGVAMTIAAMPALRGKAASIVRDRRDQWVPSDSSEPKPATTDGEEVVMGGAGLEPATPSL
jgi:hypothetical protein